MKLFYLTEHTSCYNYFKFIEEGFRYYKFDTGLNHVWGIERSGFFNDRGKWVKSFENQRV